MAEDDLTTGNAKPGARWEFDAAVTDAFEDMLRRSVPQYEVMRGSVLDAARYLIEVRDAPPRVLDLGCSRGEALAPLVERMPHGRFVGCDVSKPMLDAARERFKDDRPVSIIEWDLRNGVPTRPASQGVVLSVLTLQFTPIEHRQRILRSVRETLDDNGGFILVEKVLGETAELDDFHRQSYHRMKVEHGYSEEAVERKAMSLEGVLVPVTARWNAELLLGAGFRQVDVIWRWRSFCAWLAIP